MLWRKAGSFELFHTDALQESALFIMRVLRLGCAHLETVQRERRTRNVLSGVRLTAWFTFPVALPSGLKENTSTLESHKKRNTKN